IEPEFVKPALLCARSRRAARGSTFTRSWLPCRCDRLGSRSRRKWEIRLGMSPTSVSGGRVSYTRTLGRGAFGRSANRPGPTRGAGWWCSPSRLACPAAELGRVILPPGGIAGNGRSLLNVKFWPEFKHLYWRRSTLSEIPVRPVTLTNRESDPTPARSQIVRSIVL